jgi:hypothetical protein
MANAVTFNQNKGSRGAGVFVVRCDTSPATILLNGAGLSANATADEVVVDMSIAEIQWQTDGTLVVDRGGVDVFKAGAGSTGHMDFASNQMRLEEDGDLVGDIGVTFSTTGFAVIKVHKRSGV